MPWERTQLSELCSALSRLYDGACKPAIPCCPCCPAKVPLTVRAGGCRVRGEQPGRLMKTRHQEWSLLYAAALRRDGLSPGESSFLVYCGPTLPPVRPNGANPRTLRRRGGTGGLAHARTYGFRERRKAFG